MPDAHSDFSARKVGVSGEDSAYTCEVSDSALFVVETTMSAELFAVPVGSPLSDSKIMVTSRFEIRPDYSATSKSRVATIPKGFEIRYSTRP